MLELTHRIEHGTPTGTLTLPLEKRIRSRQRVTLDGGGEAGVFLPRGQVLHDGDLLTDDNGTIIQVCAAAEPVSEVHTDDSLLLARACYHLGNRHMQLQIEPGMVRYKHDHVLDGMLRGLGLDPVFAEAPFEPEPGAYGGSARDHAHSHPHGHSHDDGIR